MKDEIKEIIDRLEKIDHKEYIAFEFADSATFDEMARCFEERKKMADYITNLQEENEYFSHCDKKLRDKITNLQFNLVFEELKKQALENVKKNNITAKEMFKKLGYKQEKDDKIHITYYNDNFENKQRCDKQITFDLESKSFIAYSPYELSDYEDCSIFINIDELQAINKQVEELWGDEILKKNGNK